MAQPKVRQGPETAQERVLDCKATGRGEQENSPTAVSSSLGSGCHKASPCCLLLPKLNHSRFRCPQGTAGTNSPRCYGSQNLQLSKTEVNWGLQQRYSQWYNMTSGKSRTPALCLGSGTQARWKQVSALRRCSHRGPATGTVLWAHTWPHTPLLNFDTSQGQPADPNLLATSHCQHICSPARLPATF